MKRGRRPKPKPQAPPDAHKRLEDLQALYQMCLQDVKERGVTLVAGNGQPCRNPSAVLLCSLNDRIRRLQNDLAKAATKSDEGEDPFEKWRGIIA